MTLFEIWSFGEKPFSSLSSQDVSENPLIHSIKSLQIALTVETDMYVHT